MNRINEKGPILGHIISDFQFAKVKDLTGKAFKEKTMRLTLENEIDSDGYQSQMNWAQILAPTHEGV